tara:strand:+ start:1371 stop:2657 length:1287 start_codon:yes stop_codon:yes gene_type:complete
MLKLIDKIRVFKNLKSYIYIFFSKIFSQILFIPLMFYFWGVEATGIWIFLTSTINSINVFNINVSEYSFQKVILSSKSKLNAIYSNSLIITIFNTFFLSILVFLIFYFFLKNLEILENYNRQSLTIIFICLTFVFILINLIKFLYIHFYIEGKLYFNNYNQEVVDLIYKVILPFSGFFFSDLKILGYLYLILIFLNFIILLIIVHKKKNILFFNPRLVNFSKIKNNFIGSLNYNYINLTNILNTSVLNILIGLFYNAEILALTNALINLFKNTLTKIISIGNQILMFEVPFQIKKKKSELAKNLRDIHNKSSILICIIYLFSSILIGETIFNFWTLNKFDNYNFLMWMIIFESITFVLMNNFLNFFKSINKLEGLSIKILIVTLVCYFSIYILNYKYSLIEIIFLIISIKNIYIFFIMKLNYFRKLRF